MSDRSLEELLRASGNPVELLRNAQVGPNVYPGVPAEFTNWRDEQLAWQHTCVLFNQSFHMAELAVEGPDALKLLARLGVNSFENFAPGKAKQFVPCTPAGQVIGDVILFALGENEYNLVGRAPVLNWVTYHAETGGYDVSVELDQRSAMRSDGRRKHYRFQIQGPNAMQVIEKALGHPPEDLKFFNMRTERIAAREVCALRHGMVGQPGWELFGPWEDGDDVHEALVSAGEELGMRLVGGRAYSSNALESGWIPSPLPAVYTGHELKAYREWLPAAGYEGSASVGGSFDSPDIEDYYFTPWDLGYGTSSSSTTTSSVARRSSGWLMVRTGPRSRWRSTTRTWRTRSGRCSERRTAPSSWTGRRRCTRCTRSTRSFRPVRPSASPHGSATAPTRARCSRWR